MDAFDLFKKLGSGAKFDFKRFRSDAERLHILKPKEQWQQSNVVQQSKGDSKTVVIKKESSSIKKNEDSDSTSAESESDSDEASDVPNQASSGTEDSDDTSEDEDNNKSDSADTLDSTSESEGELQILGNIKSKGDETGSTNTLERKKRKQKKKVSTAQKQADLKQEQVNHVRNVHHIHTYGTDIPDPVETFTALQSQYNIHPRIIQNIEAVGFKQPTPIQIQAIPVMLHNREVMVCAPTGSGKTAAFILPILHHLKEPRNEGIRGLVLAPTRELAKQTYREFQRLSEGIGFKILYVDKIGQDTKRLVRSLKKIDILISTPNRLVYMLKQSSPLVSLSKVQWLIVDESDKLFEGGKTGFRDQLATIYTSCDGANVRRCMFSATFAYDVEEWCKLHLDNVIQVYIGARNSVTTTIEQSLLFCGSETGKLIAMRDMIRKGIQPPVLVFVQSKDRAKELFHELIYDGMNVDVIHSDRTQLQRDNVIQCFRSGKIWILICTELMGRGIDFKGVNLVINYDFPNSAITYIHRIGRTGRAGRSGKAITFFTEDDTVNLRIIANVMRSAGCPVPDYMLKINKPDKRDRRKLANSAIPRKQISTVPKYDIQKARHKRQMVHEGKKKKLREQGGENQSTDGAGSMTSNSEGDLQTSFKRKNTESTDIDNTKKRKFSDKFSNNKHSNNPFQKYNKFRTQRPPHKQSNKKNKDKSKNKTET